MSDSTEIRSVLEHFFHAMNTQNYELMASLMPEEENMVHVGTERDEIWKGWDVLMAATKKQFDNLEYYKADISNLTVNFSPDGNIAWYFHYLRAEIKSSGKITRWEKARFTGVLEKRDGDWKIMQTHVSVPG